MKGIAPVARVVAEVAASPPPRLPPPPGDTRIVAARVKCGMHEHGRGGEGLGSQCCGSVRYVV